MWRLLLSLLCVVTFSLPVAAAWGLPLGSADAAMAQADGTDAPVADDTAPLEAPAAEDDDDDDPAPDALHVRAVHTVVGLADVTAGGWFTAARLHARHASTRVMRPPCASARV